MEPAKKDFNFGVSLETIQDSEFITFLLIMNAKDNRFNPDFCTALNEALDFITSDQIPKYPQSKFSMIITGTGRFFSNGLDLNYLLSTDNPNQFLIDHYEPLVYKFLTFGIPTVALINGHAFAGGMCLALAQDYRISTIKCKALLSMNELHIKAAIPAGMLSVLRAKLSSPQILRDCIYARRWTVKEAHKDGIIDLLIEDSDIKIKGAALEFAKSKAIDQKYVQVLHAIKEETYRESSALLLDPKSDKLDPFRFALSKASKL